MQCPFRVNHVQVGETKKNICWVLNLDIKTCVGTWFAYIWARRDAGVCPNKCQS